MDIYALLCFKTVADLGNMTKAAEVMNISPSTLSHTIRKLENDIGVELFDRVGRNIILSEYGSAYLPYVSRILWLNRQGLDTIEKMKEESSNSVRIADISHLFASHLISEFQRTHPNVSLKRDYYAPLNVPLLDLIKRYDFIIGSSNAFIRQDLSSVPLRSSNSICAVMHKNHHLASRKSLTLEDIINEPILSLPSPNAGGLLIERIFERTGSVPNIVFEANSVDAILPALDSCLGIFIQPTKSAQFNKRRYGSDIVLIPIEDITYHADISLFWSEDKRLSSSCRQFKKFCTEYAKSHDLIEE